MHLDSTFKGLYISVMQPQIGESIRRIRKERGMTQGDLALKMYGDHRRQSYISRIEKGEHTPLLGNLVLFATALNCAVTDIQPFECSMEAM